MDALADLRDSGIDINNLQSWANSHKLSLHHWFFSTDLSFYVKGGRISKPAALVGTLLKICPLLDMNTDGRLIPRYKIRSKSRVVEEIVNQMAQHARGGTNYDGKCYISNSACLDDARAVANLVEARFPYLNGKVEINTVGTGDRQPHRPRYRRVVFLGRRTSFIAVLQIKRLPPGLEAVVLFYMPAFYCQLQEMMISVPSSFHLKCVSSCSNSHNFFICARTLVTLAAAAYRFRSANVIDVARDKACFGETVFIKYALGDHRVTGRFVANIARYVVLYRITAFDD